MPGVDLLFGPLLIGVMLNMILYGVVFIQMFTYYQRYTNDSAWIRCLMLYLFVVETANVAVEFGIIYQPLIVEFGTKAATTISPRLLPGDSILISIVAAPIQLFTAWRMSVITGSLILPGIIALLSLGSFGSGIAVSFFVFTNPEFRNFERFTTVIIVWLVLSATCDIVIAIGMTFALSTRRTGYVRIDGQINRIIRLTVETGALTAITALVDVGLFLIFPRTSLNFIPDLALSGLYTCSILAMLNSRDRSKTADAEHAHVQTPPNTMLSQSTLKPQPSFRSKKSEKVMFRELGRMAVKPPRNEPFPRTGNRSFSRTMAEGETFRDPERIVIAPHRKDLSRSPRTRSRTSTTIMVIREPGREAETPRPRDRFLRPRAQPCRRSRGRSGLLYQTGQCQRSF
ncbi:hypothetical protein B0H13DRAFT_2010883, partial [Mycena leptocephala]